MANVPARSPVARRLEPAHDGAQGRKSPTAKVAARLDLHPFGTATEGSTLVRDLNPRPPEPHALDSSGESRQRVATTRCSGHRCRNRKFEDQPKVVTNAQQNSQHVTPPAHRKLVRRRRHCK